MIWLPCLAFFVGVVMGFLIGVFSTAAAAAERCAECYKKVGSE